MLAETSLTIFAQSLAVYRRDFFRRKSGRQHHFKHLDFFAMSHFAVANLRGLMGARSRLQAHSALTFVFKFDPALEDVHLTGVGRGFNE